MSSKVDVRTDYSEYRDANLYAKLGKLVTQGNRAFYVSIVTWIATILLSSYFHDSKDALASILSVGVVASCILDLYAYNRCNKTLEGLRVEMMSDELGRDISTLTPVQRAFLINPDLQAITSHPKSLREVDDEGRTVLHLACMFQPDFVEREEVRDLVVRIDIEATGVRDKAGNRPHYYLEFPPKNMDELEGSETIRTTINDLAVLRCYNLPESGWPDPAARDV